MRLPRFRVRTLMVAVGVAALLVWGAMMGARSYVYARHARAYGEIERQWREIAIRDRGDPTLARSVGVKWGLQISDYYAPLARKYRRAMWRPWLPVAPDPPAPVFQ
ncbi:MAG: hypothetical protein JWN86_4668 [Planctomycetota bacterium]|nr:hypothetical protein [Planctomycetota bacterium]